MAKGGSRQTVTQTLDPATQRYLAQMRGGAVQGANAATGQPGSFFTGPQTQSIEQQVSPFLNPYISQVIGGVRGEFDHLRNQAQMATDQDATMMGAYGGARHGVASGVRAGELDRAQTSQIAGLLSGGWQNAVTQGTQYAEHQRQLQEQRMQEPIWRQQIANQFLQGGLGPVGYSQTTSGSGGSNAMGSAIGGATVGANFGPWGAAIGGGLGLLGGLLS